MAANPGEQELELTVKDTTKPEVEDALDQFADDVTFTTVSFVINNEGKFQGGGSTTTDGTVTETGQNEETTESPTPSIQRNGDPYHILRVLDAYDQWLLGEEIEKNVPDDANVNADALVNNLWRLEERDFVESQQHDDDKRFKEYHITNAGRQALMATMGEEDDESEIIQTPENRINQDSASFHLLRVLDTESWKLTSDMVDSLPSNADVNEDTVPNVMWSLTDRGLVESRKYDQDKRYKQYRLTEEGQQALQYASARKVTA